MRRAQYERELLEDLRSGLHIWKQQKALPILVAQPPLNLPKGVTASQHSLPLLRTTGRRRRPPMLARWPEHGLHASQYPYLGFVVHGEADLRFGVTQEMAKSLAKEQSSGFYVLTLPAGSFFVVPPGVPYSDGSYPHWERSNQEDASSKILWITVYPTGIALHSCITRGRDHLPSSTIFVWDARALTLSTLIIEALQTDSPQSSDIAQAYLAALLLRAEQEWLLGRTTALNQDTAAAILGNAPEDDNSTVHTVSMHKSVVRRACDYIESHVATALTLEDIAAHAFVSVAQLNRLFRAELNMSVMEYGQQQHPVDNA